MHNLFFSFFKVIQNQFKIKLKFRKEIQKCNSNCINLQCNGFEKNLNDCKIIYSNKRSFPFILVYNQSIFAGFIFSNLNSINIHHIQTESIAISIKNSKIENFQ